MIAVVPSPDPLTVILEQGGSSVWTEWGPLLGVVVGALLAASGQMLAAKKARDYEQARDLAAVRRALYARVIEVLSTIESAAIELKADGKPESIEALANHAQSLRKLDAAIDALHALHGEVAISGSRAVYGAINGAFTVGSAARNHPDRWARTADGTKQVRLTVLVLMRADLRVPDDPGADSLRTAVRRWLSDQWKRVARRR